MNVTEQNHTQSFPNKYYNLPPISSNSQKHKCSFIEKYDMKNFHQVMYSSIKIMKHTLLISYVTHMCMLQNIWSHSTENMK